MAPGGGGTYHAGDREDVSKPRRRQPACRGLAGSPGRDRRDAVVAEHVIVLGPGGEIELCGYHAHGDCHSAAAATCPLAQPEAGREIVAAVLRRERREGQFEYGGADGSSVHLASVVARETGGATITHVEITARRRREDRLRMAAALFDSGTEMHALVDGNGAVLLANAAAEQAFGRSSGGLAGVHVAELLDDGFVRANGEQIAAELQRDGRWTGEALLRDPAGDVFSAWGTVSVVTGNADRTARFLVAANAIRADGHGQDSLAAMALLDPLTGLRNRRALLEHLRFALSRAERHRTKFGVLYLDLDGFKAINDTHGHEVGDEILRQVAARLQATLRATDLCARIGGDEFTIVVEEVGSEAALEAVCGKLESALAAPFVVHGRSLRVGVSVGSVSAAADGATPGRLLDAADKAMYRAKLRRRRRRERARPDEQQPS